MLNIKQTKYLLMISRMNYNRQFFFGYIVFSVLRPLSIHLSFYILRNNFEKTNKNSTIFRNFVGKSLIISLSSVRVLKYFFSKYTYLTIRYCVLHIAYCNIIKHSGSLYTLIIKISCNK